MMIHLYLGKLGRMAKQKTIFTFIANYVTMFLKDGRVEHSSNDTKQSLDILFINLNVYLISEFCFKKK